MKKIIFILVIFAVLLFSGCDAMLEVFYPEFGAKNVLAVEYYYSSQDMIDNGYIIGNPLKIELYSPGDSPDGSSTPVRSVEIFDEASYYHEFFVPAGSYDIWIWQDNDDDGNLQNGNGFVLSPDINTTPPNYNFSGDEEYRYYYGSTWDEFFGE